MIRALPLALAVLLTFAPRLAAQAPGRMIPVEHGELYAESCGTAGRTLVLVHDGVVHSAVWDDVWPALCREFRVVRYDRRGYGRSPVASGWHSETDDLLAVFQAFGVKRASVMGSSHGGELSIDFTLLYPERVEQLVLIGAVLSGFPYTEHFIERGMKAMAALQQNDVAATIAAWSRDPYIFAPNHPAAQKRLIELLTAAPQDLTHRDWVRPSRPAFGRLGAIKVPTLLLVGDADIPDVHAHIGAIEAGIPGARRMVVKDTGHLMYLEHPAEFTELVLGFLKSHGD